MGFGFSRTHSSGGIFSCTRLSQNSYPCFLRDILALMHAAWVSASSPSCCLGVALVLVFFSQSSWKVLPCCTERGCWPSLSVLVLTKSTLGRKGFRDLIACTPSWRVVRARAWAETEAKTTEEHCSVTWLLGPLPHSFLMQPSATFPRGSLPTVGWAFPYQSLVKKMPLQTCPLANIMDAISQLKFSLLRWL